MPNLSAAFLLRLAEQALVSFLVAFGGVALAGDGSLTRGVLGGAVAAGLRAVYGLFVKNVGAEDSPSVQ